MPSNEFPGFRALFKALKDLATGLTAPENTEGTTTPAWRRRESLTITEANRADLLRFIQQAPLAYGHWGMIKQLYKQVEEAKEQYPELFTALLARFDQVAFPLPHYTLPTSLSEAGIADLSAIQVRDNYAFLLQGGWRGVTGLYIADITDPVQPASVAHIPVPNPIQLVMEGNRLYIVQPGNYRDKAAIHFVDISDPTQPRLTAKVDILNLQNIAVIGPYIAALAGNYRQGSLQILDLSNPTKPITVSETKLKQPNALKIRGNTAWLIDRTSGYNSDAKLLGYDLSDPLRPQEIMKIDLGSASVFDIDGNYACTITGSTYGRSSAQEGLKIYDLSRSGRKMGHLQSNKFRQVAVQGRYAYVAVEEGGWSSFPQCELQIIDLVDPSQPKVVGTLPRIKIKTMTPAGPFLFLSAQTDWETDGALRIVDVSDPARPLLLGASPSRRTLGYMKRRARRALNDLADSDPARYVETTVQLLATSGKGLTSLETAHQWISMDALFARSQRYQQASHGRSSYVLKPTAFALRTREERRPDLWDRYPAQAEALLTNPDIPWQVHEAALKMLRSRRDTLPPLSEALLARFLNSPSGLLIATAARTVSAQLRSGQSLAADLAAETFYCGGAPARRSVQAYIESQAVQKTLKSPWARAFSARLYALANSGSGFSRRQSRAFAYLIANFPAQLSKQISPERTVQLYATRPELADWALDTFRQASPTTLDRWLTALDPLPDTLRAPAISALRESLSDKSLSGKMMEALAYADSEWQRTIGWELISVATLQDTDLTRLWDDLLETESDNVALRTALASPAAIGLFNRLSWSGERLQALIEERPYLVALLPASALETVVRALPVAATLDLAQAASAAQWPALCAIIVTALRQSGQVSAFWQAAWQRIGETGDPILTPRLLEEPLLVDTFLELDDTSYLDTANPVFSPILARWARAHAGLFAKDSADLLKLATHMLPDLRAFGLERVGELGLSLPFALRLLESELPPSVAVGKTFFEAVSAGEDRVPEYMMVLCDSPKDSVRAYGRTYLEARWEGLSAETRIETYNRLSENPDPQTQAFVAARLLATGDRFPEASAFDRSVLRVRDKGRRAKELVKTRLTQELSQDVPLLLEMARSRTRRDADWALSQLARLALEGVEIPGLEIG